MSAEPLIVAVMGSYRRDGTVHTAVNEILAEAERQGAKVERIYLIDRHIEFCTNCRACMQEPGERRGLCVIDDDMEQILAQIEAADRLVIGSPTNFGNMNALTRKFMERCVGFAYWPWGRPAPKPRQPVQHKRAVLVSASAAPALLARLAFGTRGALKQLARVLGAKPVGTLWIGLVNAPEPRLSARQRARAHALGRKLAAG
jgi:NAD(P)H-dependent FMN reductase